MDRSLWLLQLTGLLGLAATLLLGRQLGALELTIQFVTVALLVATLMLTVYYQRKQMHAELLRDSFSMYWKTYDPVSEAELEEVQRFCEDYFDRERFAAEYSGDPIRIRKYLRMSKLYEYFAYSRRMHGLNLSDPFGAEWLERWTADLIDVPEFRDVHDYYRPYYPEYASLVDQVVRSAETDDR